MRKLYLTRQRALACFGTAYHCILGKSQEEHLEWVRQQPRKARRAAKRNLQRKTKR